MNRAPPNPAPSQPAVTAGAAVFAVAGAVLATFAVTGCSAGACPGKTGGAAEPAAKTEREAATERSGGVAAAERSGGVPIQAGRPEEKGAGERGESPAALKPEDVIRMSPAEVRPLVKRGEALLVCAYNRPEVFEDVRLEGAVSYPKFEEMLPRLPKNHLIVFY